MWVKEFIKSYTPPDISPGRIQFLIVTLLYFSKPGNNSDYYSIFLKDHVVYTIVLLIFIQNVSTKTHKQNVLCC